MRVGMMMARSGSTDASEDGGMKSPSSRLPLQALLFCGRPWVGVVVMIVARVCREDTSQSCVVIVPY